MKRKCPNCSRATISVTELIVSDAVCEQCVQVVGVHWLFRSVFFVIIFIATLFTVAVVHVRQGFYAALLMATVPVGAIGFVKARFCPLVIRQPKARSRYIVRGRE